MEKTMFKVGQEVVCLIATKWFSIVENKRVLGPSKGEVLIISGIDKYGLLFDKYDTEGFTASCFDLSEKEKQKSTNKLEITEENVRKAYDAGCNSSKKVIEKMFPNLFPSYDFEFVGKGDILKQKDGPDKYLVTVDNTRMVRLVTIRTGLAWAASIRTGSKEHIKPSVIGQLLAKGGRTLDEFELIKAADYRFLLDRKNLK